MSEQCEASIFDRSLCFCEDGGVMHTFTCELPVGHEGDHRGHDFGGEAVCGPCTWTNNEMAVSGPPQEEEK